MKRFMDKAKAFVDDHDKSSRDQPSNPGGQHGGPPQQQQHHQQPMQQQPPSHGIQPPSPADVTRYRYHHAANFGSLFILERWLCGHMFPDKSEGSSELAAVKAWVKKDGMDSARERFEKHWNEWIRDSDLQWLRDNKCTTIRLPIGYFTLGPPYCKDTAFEKYSAVYQNAWAAVKKLVQRCHDYGIGVVVDLHGLPGGANAQDHSGTNSGKAEFWGSRSYRELATRCLCFIAQQCSRIEGVAGIQIINEAEWGAKGMFEWYDSAIAEISKIDASMPVYVSDAWDLNKCLQWSQGKNSPRSGGASCPVVVDTHYYWCFSAADKAKKPQQISQEVWGKMKPLDGKDGSVIDRGAAQVIVGEYSCVLGEETWSNGGGKNDELVRQFGNAESGRFQQRAGGSFFWTYRMDWMEGGEWGFKQMTNARAITPPQSLAVSDVQERIHHAQAGMQQQKHSAYSNHAGYWDSQGGHYEHQRFADGWDLGFHDATAFFGMRSQSGGQLNGGDKIGMLDLWVLKRLRESGQGGGFVWEWEQGFRQGVVGFYQLAGI
ncbi:hypothetical protein B0A50_06987 [Salinomyces thailandicus]|uniref:Glycoside hydrolase family 5 domain-containing protein n=1 Tax=Salinomyces thailandicus TaxID=706561 RepID=A0A4U0TPW8_9PEZI|nr:hypothetical protein B0A50_06987 [Salinomyces thailandica]